MPRRPPLLLRLRADRDARLRLRIDLLVDPSLPDHITEVKVLDPYFYR